MTSTNIEAKIPLAGRGFTFKQDGNYRSGEYRAFNNVEFSSDGVISNRNNIIATGKTTNPTFSLANSFGFIGVVDGYTVLCSKDVQWATSYDANVQCWAPTSLPVGAGAGDYHKIAGVIQYNRKFYWITVEKVGTSFNVNIYTHAAAKSKITDVTFADLTKTVAFSPTVEPVITSVLIHKDRLWISTQDTVYFSKATDPTVWAVPDGGFFKIPDQVITYCFSLSDTIYVLCENAISVLTYSLDVNEDGYLRTISSNMGAEWGCIHQSVPLVVNKYGIYSITSGNLDKVVDTKFDVKENTYHHKLVSFEKNLILVRRSVAEYTAPWDSGFWYDTTASENGYNVFLVNTDTNSVSVLDYTDARDSADPGYIVDVLPNPYRDSSGSYRLFLLTNNGGYVGSTYVMSPEREEFIYDEARLADHTVSKYKPRILIEIDSFVPDGSEYKMKKFRNLLLMGKFPSSKFQLQVAYDDSSYGSPVDLLDKAVSGTIRPHFPHRFGLNQRGHAISFKLSTVDDLPIANVYDQLEFSQAHMYWTYTSRTPEYHNPSVTTA